MAIIIKVTKKLALNLSLSFRHLAKDCQVKHGPQAWPWWKMFAVSKLPIDVYAPSACTRIWVYTRWGAIYADIARDRRGIVTKRFQWF